MLKWYEKTGKNEDVVVSTRLRLARNLTDYKFADRLNEEEEAALIDKVMSTFKKDHENGYKYIYLNKCSSQEKCELMEKYVIGQFFLDKKGGAVILGADESSEVMIGAEDHIRIQVLANGMNMSYCFKAANEIDDYFDSRFEYAFDEKYGYKTTYPTNIGTGLRASYILHLPAIARAKKIAQLSTELGRFGVKFRPLYGDSEDCMGNLYRISTQRTLGQNEEGLIKDLEDVVTQIIKQEREQRDYFYNNDRIGMEDEIYKSYGVLKFARKLNVKDAMMLISEVMLGKALGILTFNDDKFNANKIVMDIQPSTLAGHLKKAVSLEETEILRAQYLRNNFPNID